MNVVSSVLARALSLSPPRARVEVTRGLRVPMPDGETLLADRWSPKGLGERLPTILVRTPYGRGPVFGFMARTFAERGYHALLQSTRGTFGSGGKFAPFQHEAKDGLATIDWILAQPWCSGDIAMYGPSYVGFVQWAVAADAPDALKAIAPSVTGSQFRSLVYPGESFSLETAAEWMYVLRHQESPPIRVLAARAKQGRAVARACAGAALTEVDGRATGAKVDFYRTWLASNAPGHDYWTKIDHSKSRERVRAPASLVSGWYDILLPELVDDFQTMRALGREVELTIGPWTHTAPNAHLTAMRRALAWFDAHLRGDRSGLREKPVRVYVMGKGEWRDLDTWPPPAKNARFHLHPRGVLSEAPPPDSSPDAYTYDPADPTPAIGGVVLGANAGPRPNRALESRSDVLLYTTPPLDRDLTIIGPVRAELFVQSSLAHADFFVRLCDVDPRGKSVNLCDGLTRVRGIDGTTRVEVELWPTANCFRAGHKIRVQVSSGAHPRFARNPGTGAALDAHSEMRAARQRIFHDPQHPSAIELPIV